MNQQLYDNSEIYCWAVDKLKQDMKTIKKRPDPDYKKPDFTSRGGVDPRLLSEKQCRECLAKYVMAAAEEAAEQIKRGKRKEAHLVLWLGLKSIEIDGPL